MAIYLGEHRHMHTTISPPADIKSNRVSKAAAKHAPQRPEPASERRVREIRELCRQGLAVTAVSPRKFHVGPLCLWPYSGRWCNPATGRGGRMNSLPVRVLIEREITGAERQRSPEQAMAGGEGDDPLKAYCDSALNMYITEADRLSELLRRFRDGECAHYDEFELRQQRRRESSAYARYRRARKHYLQRSGTVCG